MAVQVLLRASVDVPVVGFSAMFRLPMLPPGFGGQSKLVLPKFTLVPCTVHGEPAFGPSEQVPVWLKPDPLHTGHGWSTVRPVNTEEVNAAVDSPEPVSGFAVPLI